MIHAIPLVANPDPTPEPPFGPHPAAHLFPSRRGNPTAAFTAGGLVALRGEGWSGQVAPRLGANRVHLQRRLGTVHGALHDTGAGPGAILNLTSAVLIPHLDPDALANACEAAPGPWRVVEQTHSVLTVELWRAATRSWPWPHILRQRISLLDGNMSHHLTLINDSDEVMPLALGLASELTAPPHGCIRPDRGDADPASDRCRARVQWADNNALVTFRATHAIHLRRAPACALPHRLAVQAVAGAEHTVAGDQGLAGKPLEPGQAFTVCMQLSLG